MADGERVSFGHAASVLRALAAGSLVGLWACTPYIKSPVPLIAQDEAIDLSSFVGVHGAESESAGISAIAELWPAHPKTEAHFVEFYVITGETAYSFLEEPLWLTAHELPSGELLAQVWTEKDYIPFEAERTEDSFTLSYLIGELSKQKEIAKELGIELISGSGFSAPNTLAAPFDRTTLVAFLNAAAAEPPLRFERFPKSEMRAYQEFKQRMRDGFVRELWAEYRDAEQAGTQLPGREALRPVEILYSYGDPWAADILARAHFDGYYVPKDAALARAFAEEALDNGYERAATVLGFLAGMGEEKNSLLRRAAAAGDPFALGTLAMIGWEADDDAAIRRNLERLEEAAEAGDGDAAQFLGFAYSGVSGVPHDDNKARKFFAIAAEQNYDISVSELAEMLDTGRGGEADPKAAAAAYEKAARYGHQQAQYNLGRLYRQGRGVSENGKAAAKYFRQAAEQGHVDAMAELGHSFEFGWGGTRDDRSALQWYTRCADAGSAYCQWRQGVFAAEGRVNMRDGRQARYLFEKAIAGGEKRAEADLAVLQDEARSTVPQPSPSTVEKRNPRISELGARKTDSKPSPSTAPPKPSADPGDVLATILGGLGVAVGAAIIWDAIDDADSSQSASGGTSSHASAPACEQEWQIYPSTRPCGREWRPFGQWKAKYWCYTDFNYESYSGVKGVTFCNDGHGSRERSATLDPCNGKEGWCKGGLLD